MAKRKRKDRKRVQPEKPSPIALLVIGLTVVFYNQIVQFLGSFGVDVVQVNILVLFFVIIIAYYKTPWIKTILGY